MRSSYLKILPLYDRLYLTILFSVQTVDLRKRKQGYDGSLVFLSMIFFLHASVDKYYFLNTLNVTSELDLCVTAEVNPCHGKLLDG